MLNAARAGSGAERNAHKHEDQNTDGDKEGGKKVEIAASTRVHLSFLKVALSLHVARSDCVEQSWQGAKDVTEYYVKHGPTEAIVRFLVGRQCDLDLVVLKQSLWQ